MRSGRGKATWKLFITEGVQPGSSRSVVLFSGTEIGPLDSKLDWLAGFAFEPACVRVDVTADAHRIIYLLIRPPAPPAAAMPGEERQREQSCHKPLAWSGAAGGAYCWLGLPAACCCTLAACCCTLAGTSLVDCYRSNTC